MNCDCQLDRFDCEARVRRFLGCDAEKGRGALDELIAQVRPLICGVVNKKLFGTPWWQDRGDVVQEVVAVLCTPRKVQTWLDKQDRGDGAPFCHWVAPVAVNCVNNWIRAHLPPDPPPPSSSGRYDGEVTPNKLGDDEEQAKALRQTIIATLREFPWDWQLVFCMKCSYVEPTLAEIEHAAGLKESTIFFRFKKMCLRIRCRYARPISNELGKISLVGVRHPVATFDRLAQTDRVNLNRSINQFLASRPPREQLGFYAKYSPLAFGADAIASVVAENAEIVEGWLRHLETMVAQLSQAPQDSWASADA